jgi:hypothetical protein
MGFSIGVLIGVSLAAYFLGAFNPNQSSSGPRASLNCPGLEEAPPPKERAFIAGGRALALAEEQVSTRLPEAHGQPAIP